MGFGILEFSTCKEYAILLQREKKCVMCMYLFILSKLPIIVNAFKCLDISSNPLKNFEKCMIFLLA
jgi:hypothetical protein